jgi:hypothetical protein
VTRGTDAQRADGPDPGLEQVTGRFFANSKPRKSSKRSYDEATATGSGG